MPQNAECNLGSAGQCTTSRLHDASFGILQYSVTIQLSTVNGAGMLMFYSAHIWFVFSNDEFVCYNIQFYLIIIIFALSNIGHTQNLYGSIYLYSQMISVIIALAGSTYLLFLLSLCVCAFALCVVMFALSNDEIAAAITCTGSTSFHCSYFLMNHFNMYSIKCILYIYYV